MKTLLWTGLLLGSFLTVASADPADSKPSKAKATDVKKAAPKSGTSGAKDAAKPDPDKSKADQAADAAKAKADRAKDAAKNKP